eukprot:CFRG7104T1
MRSSNESKSTIATSSPSPATAKTERVNEHGTDSDVNVSSPGLFSGKSRWWLLLLAVCVALYSGTLQVSPHGIAILEQGMEVGVGLIQSFAGIDHDRYQRVPKSVLRANLETNEQRRVKLNKKDGIRASYGRPAYPGKKGQNSGSGMKKEPGLNKLMHKQQHQGKKHKDANADIAPSTDGAHETVVMKNKVHSDVNKNSNKGYHAVTFEEFKARKSGDKSQSSFPSEWYAKMSNEQNVVVDHGKVERMLTVTFSQTNGVQATDDTSPPLSVKELDKWLTEHKDENDLGQCLHTQHDFRRISRVKSLYPQIEPKLLKRISEGTIDSIKFSEQLQHYSVVVTDGEVLQQAIFRPFGGNVMDHMKPLRPNNPCLHENLPDDGWAEIVAFHLDGVLGMGIADLAVGRTVAIQTLLENTPKKYHHYLRRIAVKSIENSDLVVRGALSAPRAKPGNQKVDSITSVQALELIALMRGSDLLSQKLRWLNVPGLHEIEYPVYEDGYSKVPIRASDVDLGVALQQVQDIQMLDFLLLNPTRLETIQNSRNPTLPNGQKNYDFKNIGIACDSGAGNAIHTLDSATSLYALPCLYSIKGNGQSMYEPQCVAETEGTLKYNGKMLDFEAYKNLFRSTHQSQVGDMSKFLKGMLEGDMLHHCIFDPSTRFNMEQHRHRVGQDLTRALNCDPLSAYGSIMQYLPEECYASGMNYRLEMILEIMNSCDVHEKRFEEWISNPIKNLFDPLPVSDENNHHAWYANHCPVGESKLHGVWEASEDKNSNIAKPTVDGEVVIDSRDKVLKMNLQ